MAQLSTGGGPQNFAIYYVVRDKAFLRAAQTWKSGLKGESCEVMGVAYMYQLVSAFRNLSKLAKQRGAVFSRGALFVHSSPPNADEKSQQRGVHFRPVVPKSWGELKHKEEVLRPAGLEVDTASVAILKDLDALPWAPGGLLEIFGCLSGYSEPGRQSLAEILMKSQRVRTTGQTGKSYFSKSADVYERITEADSSIYLRAFYRAGNVQLDLGGDVDLPAAEFGHAMPEKEFTP